MKNKKGFTLVELLAVMVILIIIIIIAYAVIKRNVDETLDNTIRANAGIYIKAVNSMLSEKSISDSSYDAGTFTISDLESEGIKISGTKPDAGYVYFINSEVMVACLTYDGYVVNYSEGDFSDIQTGECSTLQTEYTYDYSGSVETFTAPISGNYKIELWGAEGGTDNALSAKGSYTSGVISLKHGTNLYVYVGGSSSNTVGGYNGGGSCYNHCSGGGGATDVRLVDGDWNNANSLASRIMVAAGGAGYNTYNNAYPGGAGGTLSGLGGAGDSPTTLATQISAGISNGNVQNRNGQFGIGGYGDDWGGGGSGGYWGGAGGKNSSTGNGGASGSSYISGYEGSIAIKASDDLSARLVDNDTVQCTNELALEKVECSYHYSGKKFVNATMLSGTEEMPNHDGTSTIVGNTGSGYARITLVF